MGKGLLEHRWLQADRDWAEATNGKETLRREGELMVHSHRVDWNQRVGLGKVRGQPFLCVWRKGGKDQSKLEKSKKRNITEDYTWWFLFIMWCSKSLLRRWSRFEECDHIGKTNREMGEELSRSRQEDCPSALRLRHQLRLGLPVKWRCPSAGWWCRTLPVEWMCACDAELRLRLCFVSQAFQMRAKETPWPT